MSCNKSLSHVFPALTGLVQFLCQIWRVWTFYHVYITQNVRFLEIRNAENFVRFPKGKLPLIVRWWILCTISNLFCVWLRFFNMAGYENWQWKLILSPLGGLPWSKAMQPNKNICFDPSKIVCHCSLILTYKCLQQQLLFYCVLLWLVLVWKCSWWILCDFSARSRWNTASPLPLLCFQNSWDTFFSRRTDCLHWSIALCQRKLDIKHYMKKSHLALPCNSVAKSFTLVNWTSNYRIEPKIGVKDWLYSLHLNLHEADEASGGDKWWVDPDNGWSFGQCQQSSGAGPVATMPGKIEPSSGTDLEHQCQFPVQMKVILDLYSADKGFVVEVLSRNCPIHKGGMTFSLEMCQMKVMAWQ